MKIVIAPNAFKGTITGGDAANAIEKGILKAIPNAKTLKIPVSDGGDGSLTTFIDIFNGLHRSSIVNNPLCEDIESYWGLINNGKTAFIETALAFGLCLIPEDKRNPYITSSRGVGDLINCGIDLGINDFIIGVGGSANNDGGTGMLRALGVRFLDSHGVDLKEGGYELRRLSSIVFDEINPIVLDSNILMLSDSSVPLVGETGVSIMYSEGKGATKEMAQNLDASLRNYADVVHRHTGIDISNKPSSGSGGGVTSAAEVFLGAEVRYGIDVVLEKINFESKLEGADLVIVAEGQLDAQTIYNKAPIGVAKIAKNRNIPVICVSAVLGDGYEESFKHGVDALVGIASDNSWVDKNSIVNENDIVNAIHDVFMQIKVNNFKIETGTEYSPRRSE